MQGAAGNFKKVTLELGGKSANLNFRGREFGSRGARGSVGIFFKRRPGLLRGLAPCWWSAGV